MVSFKSAISKVQTDDRIKCAIKIRKLGDKPVCSIFSPRSGCRLSSDFQRRNIACIITIHSVVSALIKKSRRLADVSTCSRNTGRGGRNRRRMGRGPNRGRVKFLSSAGRRITRTGKSKQRRATFNKIEQYPADPRGEEGARKGRGRGARAHANPIEMEQRKSSP